MPTENPFFKHDLNARNDRKMMALASDFKSAGHGIFWVLLEILYSEGGVVDNDDLTIMMVARALFEDFSLVKNVVQNCIEKYHLFDVKEGKIISNRASAALHKMKGLSQVRSENGKKGAIASHLPGKRQPNAKKKGKKEGGEAIASLLPGNCQPLAWQNLHKEEDKEEDINTVIVRKTETEFFLPPDPEKEIQNPDTRRGVEHPVEHDPPDIAEFGSPVVVYDIEVEILKNPIYFEQLCMTTGVDPGRGKEILHDCHLWYVKNEKYPVGKKAGCAQFETFLRNKKYHQNEFKRRTSTESGPKLGVAAKRIEALRKF